MGKTLCERKHECGGGGGGYGDAEDCEGAREK